MRYDNARGRRKIVCRRGSKSRGRGSNIVMVWGLGSL